MDNELLFVARPQPGRQRFGKQALPAVRERVERPGAWEAKGKRVWRRVEPRQGRHYGRKLMASTLIQVRRFCAT